MQLFYFAIPSPALQPNTENFKQIKEKDSDHQCKYLFACDQSTTATILSHKT